MSEYIDNAARRKEAMKDILRQLAGGAPTEAVQAEFDQLSAGLDSAGIAAIEQSLIDEGTPVEEIQRLCDLHVAAFRTALEAQVPPESLSGHPVHTFLSENQILIRYLDEMHATLAKAAKDESSLGSFSLQVRGLFEFIKHYRRKESLLFPYLEKKGLMGPSKVMWGIHDEIRSRLKNLDLLSSGAQAGALPLLVQSFDEIDSVMRSMIYKEEKVFLPAALERLDENDWLAIRSQEDEIGYFFLAPGSDWPSAARAITAEMLHTQYESVAPEQSPTTQPPAAQTPINEQNASGIPFPLQTGALTLEQITLMLTHLPVDITFVDENDEVRFYSQTRERIFERVPAIIGRKVQNCHPPQSVSAVQRILDDFKSGARETAEFWIQMMGKFIHIQYYAVRDAAGAYRGTIEVTQELTHLRSIQGERRLLDD